MLTRAALKNPYAVFALCMIALILGGVSYQKMRVDIFPEIKLPSILVTTFYRGLSPSEMEGAITFRLEQRFVEASYVEHIESQSLARHAVIFFSTFATTPSNAKPMTGFSTRELSNPPLLTGLHPAAERLYRSAAFED